MPYVTSSTTIPVEMHEEIKKRGLKVSHLVRIGFNYLTEKTELHGKYETLMHEVKKRDDMLLIWKKKVNRLEQQVYGGGTSGETDESGGVQGHAKPDPHGSGEG